MCFVAAEGAKAEIASKFTVPVAMQIVPTVGEAGGSHRGHG